MSSAEIRLLRFLQSEGTHIKWIPYSSIRNTEALLPGDEKALPALLERGLIEKEPSQSAYRVSDRGLKLCNGVQIFCRPFSGA
jgi:RIO-like serine/threonine protein kinase